MAPELEPEGAELDAVAAVPVAVPDAAPGVGAPKLVTPVGIGLTGADAEAPTPTKFPTLCCKNNGVGVKVSKLKIKRTTGVVVTALAAAWKEEKVFPLVGALMAPTIPDHAYVNMSHELENKFYLQHSGERD